MPRLSRLNISDACYLVEQRRPALFVSASDYDLFSTLLAERAHTDAVSVLGFCFLPDCFTLLVKIRKKPVGAFLNHLEAAYARAARTTPRLRQGFSRRPRVLLFDPDAYLVKLLRYLHWRPVTCGLCAELGEYPWTSHAAYSTGRAHACMSLEPALRLMGGTKSGYAQCMNGKPDSMEIALAQGPGDIDPRVLGGRAFLATLPIILKYRNSQTFDTLAGSVALAFGLDVTAFSDSRHTHTLVLARAVLVWHCIHRHVAGLRECSIRLRRDPRTLQRAVARYRRLCPKYFRFEELPDAAPIVTLLPRHKNGKG